MMIFLFFLSFFKNVFIFGCAGSSLLHRLFSSCGEQGLLCSAARRLPMALISLGVERGSWST